MAGPAAGRAPVPEKLESASSSALTEFLFLSNNEDATVLNDDRSLQLLAKYLGFAIDTFVAEHYGR